MKRWLIGLLAIMVMPVLAQNTSDAETLLKEVIEKTASYKNFKADLGYTMINQEMNIDEKKTGVIYVQGDAYRLEMEGQMIISDGSTVWTYLPDSEEVMVSDVEDSDESISPTKILSKYSDDYKARFDNDKKYQGTNFKEISLKAEDGNNFDQLSVVVDAKNTSLESFSIYDKNGNVFTYQIISLQSDIVLQDSVFTFVAANYPGVEVIDMR
jgi:chaperone LolA